MMRKLLPRFVISKTLASGVTAFYFNINRYYRKRGCTIPNEPLGTDYIVACGENGDGGRAAGLNGLFDEWDATRRGEPIDAGRLVRFGNVDWLFREYKSSKAYLEKVSLRSRPDYERTMLIVSATLTKKGDRIGGRSIRSITPRAADKLYDKFIQGKRGQSLRQGEKAIALCAKAWDVVRRLYPGEFDKQVPNPWNGVTIQTRTKKKKPAADRDQVYTFAWGCIERGIPSQPQQRLSVSNGFSARKTSWQATFAGRTTAAKNGQTQFTSSTTRPASRSGTRLKRRSITSERLSTPTLKRSWPSSHAGAFR